VIGLDAVKLRVVAVVIGLEGGGGSTGGSDANVDAGGVMAGTGVARASVASPVGEGGIMEAMVGCNVTVETGLASEGSTSVVMCLGVGSVGISVGADGVVATSMSWNRRIKC
jgi:hypothetical protein